MATCRFCGMGEGDRSNGIDHYKLVKYGVRHYGHADCLLRVKGAAAFQLLTPWQCTQFPYSAAVEAGLAKELESRCSEYKK